MTNCSLAEARRSNGRAALSTTGPCGTFQTCSQWEQSRHHFDLAQRPLVSAALIEAQSPPVSIMPISVAITTLMIMPVWLVRISAITHGRVGAAHRFAVTVAVPRRVGAEVRKALRERDSRRAQEHRQCQNDRLHGPILRCRCSENRESRGCVPEVCRVLATERCGSSSVEKPRTRTGVEGTASASLRHIGRGKVDITRCRRMSANDPRRASTCARAPFQRARKKR